MVVDSTIDDFDIAGPHGPVPARLYRPAVPSGEGLVWVHGGSFIAGNLDMNEANWVAMVLAVRGITVLSLDYRKALDGVRFPVPSDDVLAGWRWAAKNSHQLSDSRLHLGGASAGGALACGVAMRLRDNGEGLPRSIVLAYPLLHPQSPQASAELAEKTATLPRRQRFLPDDVEQMSANYAGDLASDPYAFPGNDPGQLPPILIVNSDRDDLRGSGEEFARQVRATGASVTCSFEPGSTHGHLDRPGQPEGFRTLDTISRWILRQE